MEVKRSYRRRGTPDLPVATYIGIAGKNMRLVEDAEYHPEIEVVLQVKGTSTGEMGGRVNTYHEGDIWIIPSGMIHRRIGFSEDARVHRVIFSTEAIRMPPAHFFQREFVQPLSEGLLEMPTLLQPGHPAYPAVQKQLMALDGCRIYEKNYKQNRLSVVMGICLALMPYCRTITFDTPIPDPGHEGVKLCMRYLHNNHTRKITLEELSEYCHLHPNYLCAVFKAYAGETVFEYLNRIRVESAQRLLCEDLPVSEVAELAGFHSECFFYRKFKALIGMTPKAYQKHHRTGGNKERRNEN